ncbi:MAG: ATP-binding domain-containing protein [Candidatus Rokuibacteriota bacterium]
MLARARRGFVTAAAGCGKTDAIAAAVTASGDGRQLVLTHTHAGVKALRQRLQKYKAPKDRYHVDTLAGWALNYAVHYPNLSRFKEAQPTGASWSKVYDAAERVLDSSAVRRVVTESYAGFYVDEYQDCTVGQHRLVLRMADLLPCRILGDPLQGIFDFDQQPPINWAADVETNFERLPDLAHPWRWTGSSPDLGRRLMEIRAALLAGDEIDLQTPPLVWRPLSPEEEWRACLDAARQDGSVVAIHKWAPSCHALAKKLRGRFTSMEQMESPDLLKWAKAIGWVEGTARAVQVIEFAAKCMTLVGTELGPLRDRMAQGALPDIGRVKKHRGVVQALLDVAGSGAFDPVLPAFEAIEQIPGRVLYRRELWREIQRAVQLHIRTPGGSLPDAAWKVRNRTRHAGRAVEHRTISRTLLVKGLEFDHVVVLNAADHDAKNLYVAMTRASRSLTVLSKTPRIRLARPSSP